MVARLSVKDLRVIAALDEDGRMPVERIASKAGLSKQTAGYRLKVLENSGVLKATIPVVNFTSLGYLSFQLYVKLSSFKPSEEQKIFSFLKKHAHVGWAVRCSGSWDLLVIFLEETPYEFQRDLTEFFSLFGKHVTKKAVSSQVGWTHLNLKYLTGVEGKQVIGASSTAKLDNASKLVLSSLSQNARKTLKQISLETRLPASTVAYKLSELKKSKVILGFVPLIDFSATGYEYCHVLLQTRPGSGLQGLKEFLEHQKNVVYITESIGEYDLEAEVHVKSSLELNSFLLSLRGKFGDVILSDETALVFNVIKYDYYPFKS